MQTEKPLGINNYGTIPHLIGSRVTIGDKHCHEGQVRIATEKVRDRHDDVIVTEKLDGSNCGVCLLNGEIIALTRAGYRAETSPYEQHWHWNNWVKSNESRFRYVLKEGERIVGEWLMQAHGTRYNLMHEPFVVFDLMREHTRLCYDEMISRTIGFSHPKILHRGNRPLSIEASLNILGEHGWHGAVDLAEGCVWKIERKGQVDFMCKFVRPDKVDGVYLPQISKKDPVWNWYPYGYVLSDKMEESNNGK